MRWAERQGYEELVQFDGGASTEFNVGGRAVVAGTSRHIPLWFGIVLTETVAGPGELALRWPSSDHRRVTTHGAQALGSSK